MTNLEEKEKCSCGEPHISDMIIHCYGGKPCYVKAHSTPTQEAHKKGANTEVSAPIPTSGGDEWEEEFDKKFDWIDCGSFNPRDETVRTCYVCGHKTRYCENCLRDHHIGNRDTAIKSFIRENRLALLQRLEEDVEREIAAIRGQIAITQDGMPYKLSLQGYEEALLQVFSIITNFKKE